MPAPRILRRVLRIAWRTALVLVLVLAVALGIALVVVHTDWARGKVKDRVVAAMNETFPGGVTIRALEGSLVGDVVLRDVVIRDRAGHDAITVERLELNLGLAGLLDDTLRVEHATATGVAVRIHAAPGEPLNVADLVVLSDEPFTWHVALDRVAIRDGEVTVEVAGRVDHVDALAIDARLDYALDGTLLGSLDLRGQWRETGQPLTVETSRLRVGPDGVIEARDLAVAADGSTVTGAALRYAGPTDASGTIELRARQDALARFLPRPRHPATTLRLEVAPDAERTALEVAVAGTAGTAALSGRLAIVPIGEVRIGGHLRVTGADARAFSTAAVTTALDADVSFGLVLDTPLPGGTRGTAGLISVGGKGTIAHLALDRIAAHATVTGEHVALRAVAAGSGATAEVTGAVRLQPDGAIRIEPTRVIARARDLAPLLPELGLAGRVETDVRVSGTISELPPVLAFDGTVLGHDLRYAGVRAGTIDADLDAFRLDLARPNRPTGAATVAITGGTIDGQAVPTTTVTLRSQPGDSYALTATSSGTLQGPGSAPWAIDLVAVAHPGADDRSVVIDLDRYAVRTGGVPWAGRGGRVTVTPDKVTVARVAGTVDTGEFAVDGEYGFGGRRRYDATIAARGVHLAQVDRALDLAARGIGPLGGDADVAVEVHGRGRELTGTAEVEVRGLVLRDGAEPLDGTLDLTVERDRIAGSVEIAGRSTGELAVALDTEPPSDLTDPRAWARLERRAIRSLTVRADRIDVVALGLALGVTLPLEGTFAAELALGPEGSAGQVRARDVIVPGVPGMLDADVRVDLADLGVVQVTADVALREIAHGSVDATVRVAPRPFDFAAWAALDITALRKATIGIAEITIDDRLARRLGLGGWRGSLGGSVEIDEAMSALRGRIALRGITGAVIERPVDVVVDAALGAAGLRATLSVAIDGATVATGEASAPVDPDRIAAVGVAAAVRDVPVAGSVKLVELPIASVIQTLGQPSRIAGTIAGSGTLGGTLAAPIARATVVVTGLGGRRNRIDELKIDGSYARGAIAVALTGAQQGGGSVRATLAHDTAAPEATELAITAQRFQVSPIMRLIPGVIGIRGVLDADLRVVGVDPGTARARGTIRVREAQIPVVDEVGAITGGTLELTFGDGTAKLAVAGKSEGGDVELQASADLDGLLPRRMTLDAAVRDLTIISTLQPRLAATLHAEVALAGDHWEVDARLRDGRIVIPDDEGEPLHPASPPSDVVFVERGTIRTPPRAKAKRWFQHRPTDPFVVIALRIDPVEIASEQLRGEVSGRLEIAAGDDGVAIDGEVEARTGEVMVFDRRYLIERAQLAFDGPPDPLLDIQLQRDFAAVSMTVAIRGRLSDPELELTSSPAVYTEGQLLGFLLGGTPGSPSQDSREALSGAAAAVAAQTVGGWVTRRLPVRVDVLRFEPATSSSSAAFAVGRWISDKLLVMIRSRVEPRVDENDAETEVEYWLTDRTLIDATGGNKGVFGLDLLWTKRW